MEEIYSYTKVYHYKKTTKYNGPTHKEIPNPNNWSCVSKIKLILLKKPTLFFLSTHTRNKQRCLRSLQRTFKGRSKKCTSRLLAMLKENKPLTFQYEKHLE